MVDPRSHWTPEETARLITLADAGATRADLLDAFPGRTYASISVKMSRMGVKVRSKIEGCPPIHRARKSQAGLRIGSLHHQVDDAIQQSLVDEAYHTGQTIFEVINRRLKAAAP